MKALWITNILFPEAMALLTGEDNHLYFGGWMTSAADTIAQIPDLHLTVATVSPLVKKLTFLHGDIIDYYIIPIGKGNETLNHEYDASWKEISIAIKPDIVHIHGTEYTHGLSYLQVCNNDNVVISIQGLVSVAKDYYYAGIPKLSFLINTTIRDLLRGTIFYDYRKFVRKGKYELEMLRRVSHVIGRTTWDRVHSLTINPNLTYHFCNETLRPSFYSSQWSYEKCTPHSIFVSQASYPLKGLHQVLKALSLIVKKYPDTCLYVSGVDITRKGSFRERIKISSYGLILKKMIKRLRIEDRVFFIGLLDESKMKEMYLQSNVFVCPSSIENSPNSLCEAQLLGVPCVCSYVGGIPDLSRQYLYRFDDIEMLANSICSIFNQASTLNNNEECQIAHERHDPVLNARRLFQIYQSIVESR